MAITNFNRFVTVASQYKDLIRDLCTQQDVIDRAQLLHYLETHNIPPSDKDSLIQKLCDVLILIQEGDQEYTVNQVVIELVNYYERRGRLTNATFLRDQIATIAEQTDELQRQISSAETSNQIIADTVDSLYRLVSEVRQRGEEHYFACMRDLGDMKRNAKQKTASERISDLETIQRRHIDPLTEIIDHDGAYAEQMRILKRRIIELSSNKQLLARSQETDSHRRRLIVDLKYIENTLLARLITISDTARALLKTLIAERNIKESLAYALSHLDQLWEDVAGQTVLYTQEQFTQAPSHDDLGEFFNDILHLRLLPNPLPLHFSEVDTQWATNDVLLRQKDIVAHIQQAQQIQSWPDYVATHFGAYPDRQQLRAMTWPLINMEHPIEIYPYQEVFTHHFPAFTITMKGFGVAWRKQI